MASLKIPSGRETMEISDPVAAGQTTEDDEVIEPASLFPFSGWTAYETPIEEKNYKSRMSIDSGFSEIDEELARYKPENIVGTKVKTAKNLETLKKIAHILGISVDLPKSVLADEILKKWKEDYPKSYEWATKKSSTEKTKSRTDSSRESLSRSDSSHESSRETSAYRTETTSGELSRGSILDDVTEELSRASIRRSRTIGSRFRMD